MKAAMLPLGVALLSAGLLNALELQPSTLKAWDAYVRSADSRMQARLASRRPFLWTDEAPDRSRRLQRGKTLVVPVTENGAQSVPNGLIHDWMGAVFIPNVTLAKVTAVLRDYGRYKEYYKPVVADSKVLACTETDQRFSMIWQQRVLFVSAAIEGQYQAHDFAVDGRRGYSIANTTQMREIEGYGQSTERFLPPGQGDGFIWRLHSIARYEERDGGVYLELEAIALTRDIPASFGWLMNPVVKHLSINSLTTALRQTRDAVNSAAGSGRQLVSCAQGGRYTADAKVRGED